MSDTKAHYAVAAQRVFGGALFIEGDEDDFINSTNNVDSNNTSRNNINNNDADGVMDSYTTKVNASLSYSPSPTKSVKATTIKATMKEPASQAKLGSIEPECDCYHSSNSRSDASLSSSSSSPPSPSSRRSTASYSSSGGPFEKLVAPTPAKENRVPGNTASSASQSTIASDAPCNTNNDAVNRPHFVTKQQPQAKPMNARGKSIENTNNSKDRQQIVNYSKRPSLRPDLVQQTQEAIQRATVSVNASIVAAQASKRSALLQKRQQTAQVKQEWHQDVVMAKKFHQEAEKSRRDFLATYKNLSQKFGHEKAMAYQRERQQRILALDQESDFESVVYRDHKETLKQDQQSRRRLSEQVRAQLRQNHRAGEQKLRLQRIEEDHAIYEERREASFALRQTQLAKAAQRRQSFAFRKGDALRIRHLYQKMEEQQLQDRHESYELEWAGQQDSNAFQQQLLQQRRESLVMRSQIARQQREHVGTLEAKALQAEHESFELKWAAEKDAEAYQKEVEAARRKSLAMRNQYGKAQREQIADERSIQLEKKHESYELKWAGERDATAYRRELEVQRRESLAGRNAHARQTRQVDAEIEAHALEIRHQDYELKWAAERDVDAHQKQMAKQRRESLAARNQESARHAQVMDELKSLVQERETESYILKWAGENDAKVYLAKLKEQRRQSLQQRGRQVLHQRSVEDELRAQELAWQHQDEELRSAEHKDVEEYRRKCAERDRLSLEYRRKEARIQRMEEQDRLDEQRQQDHRNFELETEAHLDVERYFNDCQQRRRYSLVQRAKERRMHATWQQQQTAQELQQESQLVRDRMMDQRYVEMAQQQERAKAALDSIRHYLERQQATNSKNVG